MRYDEREVADGINAWMREEVVPDRDPPFSDDTEWGMIIRCREPESDHFADKSREDVFNGNNATVDWRMNEMVEDVAMRACECDG